MAYVTPTFGYQQTPADSSINAKAPQYFAENDSDIIESALLNPDIMQEPNAAPMRKDTYVPANAILSPTTPHAWPGQYTHGLPVDHSGIANHYRDEHHSFGQETAHAGPSFGHATQPANWGFEQGSGNCTPTNRMDFVQSPAVAHFDAPHYVHHRTDSARGSFSHATRPSVYTSQDDNFIPAPSVQAPAPMSPHTHQDWMNMVAQEAESRPHSKRMSTPRTAIDFQRGDGIRKKNARIDIPQERSIQTIEHLLEITTDEEMTKELKQQKRLLRNREAALASRQRKKKHTEDLEHREKEFAQTVDGLHTQIRGLQHERDSLERNYQIVCHQLQEHQRQVESLKDETRNMQIAHLGETSSLRKRLRLLTEQVEDEAAPAMSAVPSSTGFADFSAEMEALHMGSNDDWENLLFSGDLQHASLDDLSFDPSLDSLHHPSPQDRVIAPSAVVPAPSKPTSDTSSDPNVSSGLLFFLLLCGAFVASRPSSTHPPDLPQVPANVRAAAPKVLNNLLYDGQRSQTPTNAQIPHLDGSEPGPSALPTRLAKGRSKLDRMHHRITAPTKQQEIDSAFSLTTAEFASITNMDYPVDHHDNDSSRTRHNANGPRRPLAEALANMSEDPTRISKADVYTRSLLWDQIPADVVKQFRELVRDSNEIDAREQQRQRQHNDDTIAFKAEST